MGTSGDKIVLLDGMGSGSGSATNGLLSMIQGKGCIEAHGLLCAYNFRLGVGDDC